MLSTPITMKKLSLYMVDTDAQKAAMTLAQMAVIHPLENLDDKLPLVWKNSRLYRPSV